MRVVSDLTKDLREDLRDILVESISDIIAIDKQSSNENIDVVEYENFTFYYRAIYLFMQRSILYYQREEIEEWLKKEILKEPIMPEVGSLREFLLEKIEPNL